MERRTGSTLADLATGFELVGSMRAVPVANATILPLILAALMPLGGAALNLVPSHHRRSHGPAAALNAMRARGGLPAPYRRQCRWADNRRFDTAPHCAAPRRPKP